MQIAVPHGDEFLDDVVSHLYGEFNNGVDYGPEEKWRPLWTRFLQNVTSFGVPGDKELDWDTWLTRCYPECAVYLVDEGKLAGFSIFNEYGGMEGKHAGNHSLQLQASLELRSLGKVTDATYATLHKQRAALLSHFLDPKEMDFNLTLELPGGPHTIKRLSPDDQYLFYLVVDKAYRNKGYGTLLVEETCRRAAEKGAKRIFSHAANPRSRCVHRKAGFEGLLYIEPFYPDLTGTTLMGKSLREGS